MTADRARRSYGSGSLFVYRDRRGNEAWYGKWYSAGRRFKRKIGPKRKPGTREGLTRAQAERELQRRMDSERVVVRSRLTVEEAGRGYLEHRRNFSRLELMLSYLQKDLQIQEMRASRADRTQIENEIRSLVDFLQTNIDKGVFILTGRNDFARFTKKYGLTNQSLLD